MAKSKQSKRGKQELKRHQQEDVRRYRTDSRKGKIASREGVLIYVPVQSFLPGEEQRWIAFVNRREWWNKEARPDFIEAIDHILKLLSLFLDALEKDEEERARALQKIAEEINKRMRLQKDKLGFPLLGVNQTYSPEAIDPLLPLSQRPFVFADPDGLAGDYISLARFLGGAYARRLKRCKHCRGLFIAPNDHRHEYCPLTDHKDRYWQSEREKIGYHRAYQAARRNPDSSM